MFQRDLENWYKFNFDGVGQYGIPLMQREDIQNKNFIPFNYAKSCKNPSGKGVHFFIHDYQFQRLWNTPERYVQMLRQFECVCTPDYSLYVDMPKAMQIYQQYKKQWLGAYWQAWGLTVIPTVSWSDAESFEWCFDGIPQNSTVAVSSVGCLKDNESIERFLVGYRRMKERIEPEQILFYGTVPEQIEDPVIHLKSFQERFKRGKGDKTWEEEGEAVESRGV